MNNDHGLERITPASASRLRDAAKWIRNMAEMMKRQKAQLSNKNVIAHARMDGRVEMANFIADLLYTEQMGEVEGEGLQRMAVVGPYLTEIVMPHIKAFVQQANALTDLAESQGVRLPTVQEALGNDRTRWDVVGSVGDDEIHTPHLRIPESIDGPTD